MVLQEADLKVGEGKAEDSHFSKEEEEEVKEEDKGEDLVKEEVRNLLGRRGDLCGINR